MSNPSQSERLRRVAYARALQALHRARESRRALDAARREQSARLERTREHDDTLPPPPPEIL